jgi:hypothetical protein
MKVLTHTTHYEETIPMALALEGEYPKEVCFHFYWNGTLNEKHFYSILSCAAFHKRHKLVLWLENNIPNEFNAHIEKYAEIRPFCLANETQHTFLDKIVWHNPALSFYSDVVRYVLLYKYGGVWLDLDCFVLRSFDPLFGRFENEICVYQWENQNYPNGAVYISLEAKSDKMKKNIQFIMTRNRGWGFQEAHLTYDLPLDLLVLPCSWFDASWITNPDNLTCDAFFKSAPPYTLDTFFKGSFCYHWHNRWNYKVEKNSILDQLVQKLVVMV